MLLSQLGSRPVVVLVAHLAVLAALVPLVVMDVRTRRIPNRVVFPLFAASLPALILGAAAEQRLDAVPAAVCAAILSFVLIAAVHLLAPTSMGAGDAKLALVLGLYTGWAGALRLGWFGAVTATMVSLLVACVAALAGVAISRGTGRAPGFAFGPSLALGAAAMVVIAWP